MKTYSFIVNPKAGRGKGAKLIPSIQAAIAHRHLNAEVLLTQKEGHATELASHAPAEVIVAVGGDGTVNEVANGLVHTQKAMGIIPIGSGNDFVKAIGIPAEVDAAFDRAIGQTTRRVDCGSIETARQPTQLGNSHRRYFVNGVGIGFDAAVAERTREIKFLRGTAVYVLAVFQTLGKYQSPDFSVTIDSQSSNSRNLLIAIGNGICAGGGFYLTPKAQVDDGLLDICLIEEMSVPRILSVMPMVMKGKHEGWPGVRFEKARNLRVTAPQEFFVHADGEMVGRNVCAVDIQISEKALEVVV